HGLRTTSTQPGSCRDADWPSCSRTAERASSTSSASRNHTRCINSENQQDADALVKNQKTRFLITAHLAQTIHTAFAPENAGSPQSPSSGSTPPAPRPPPS